MLKLVFKLLIHRELWVAPFFIVASMVDCIADPVPGFEKVGDCKFSKIREISTCLNTSGGKAVPGSGSSVLLENGIRGVSYDQLEPVDESKAGDKVLVCLVYIPKNCPPGDRRGRVYAMTNLRSVES